MTTIFDAVINGDCETLELLLKNGTNPNETNKQGHSLLNIALHRSEYDSNYDCVVLLLEAGANPNYQHSVWHNKTSLHIAIHQQHTKCANLLLKYGADPNAIDGNDHDTPLHCLAMRYWYEPELKPMIKALLKAGAVFDKQNRDKMTPLHTASVYGNNAFVKSMIKLGANINERCKYGNTLLYLSIDNEYISLARMLLRAGADPNVEGYKGMPLHILLRNGDEYKYTLRLLLKSGANPNACLWDNRSPLHIAIEYGPPIYVRILLKAGANINVIDNNGKSPLDCALKEWYYIDTIKTVLNDIMYK